MENIYLLLSDKEKQLFTLKKYKQKQKIASENEICEYFYIVKSGHIKISTFLENGLEVVYTDLLKDSVFGNNLLFSKEPYFRGDVISISESEIYTINKSNLLSLLKNNQKFLQFYIGLQSEFAKELNLKIKLISITTAEERVLYYLKFNKGIFYGSVTDFSSRLFLTREATSRAISKLKKIGKIKKEKAHIELIKNI